MRNERNYNKYPAINCTYDYVMIREGLRNPHLEEVNLPVKTLAERAKIKELKKTQHLTPGSRLKPYLGVDPKVKQTIHVVNTKGSNTFKTTYSRYAKRSTFTQYVRELRDNGLSLTFGKNGNVIVNF